MFIQETDGENEEDIRKSTFLSHSLSLSLSLLFQTTLSVDASADLFDWLRWAQTCKGVFEILEQFQKSFRAWLQTVGVAVCHL